MTFRRWLEMIWQEHVEECWAWEGHAPAMTKAEYFAKYKYWLRREYRHQQGDKRGS